MLFAILLCTAAASPKAQLESSIESVRKILKNDNAQKREADLRTITVSYIDFARLAETTLDGEWQKLSAAKRKEFAKVLEDLIEASYLGRLDESSSVDIALSDEKVEGEQATIRGAAHVQGADSDLVFHLYKGAKQWMADDVELDDVSLNHNYRAQFQKTIAKDGYAMLVTKLKKKITELKSPQVASGRTAHSGGQ